MKNKNTLIKIEGFSLAETLITLLIVTILVIASVPVITKKQKVPALPSGKWMCTLNAQGQHVVWKTGDANMNNSDLWKVTNKNYCEFEVPKNARNFAITAVGGGGGGAGAGIESRSWTSSFQPPYAGVYKMAVIGAGGNGAKGNVIYGVAPGGGGAGGVVYAKYELTDSVKYLYLTKGIVNSDTTNNQNGTKGGFSEISAQYQDNLYNMQTLSLLKADGGEGGRGCVGITPTGFCNKWQSYYGKQGAINVYTSSNEYIKTIESQSFNTSTGNAPAECDDYRCFGYRTVADQLKINEKMLPYTFFNVYNSSQGLVRDYYEGQYGRGGTALHQAEKENNQYYNQKGRDGYVMVTTAFHKPGQGGQAGQAVERDFHSEFNSSKLIVTIGKGGIGGSAGTQSVSSNKQNPYVSKTNPTNGGNGGTTSISGLFDLYGGQGGQALVSNDIVALKRVEGGDGEASPINYSKYLVVTGTDQELRKLYQKGWGGLAHDNYNVNGITSPFYGAGGGGGAVDEASNTGKGANGSPGFVLIEW